jgi:hypothetical protein
MRIMQCREKRYKKKQEQNLLNHGLQQNKHHTTQHCIQNFGFCANPKFSLQKTFYDTIKKDITYHPQQPTNLTFHNLCKTIQIPHGTRHLLGLSLKYCLASSHLPDNIKTTVQKWHMPYVQLSNFRS